MHKQYIEASYQFVIKLKAYLWSRVEVNKKCKREMIDKEKKDTVAKYARGSCAYHKDREIERKRETVCIRERETKRERERERERVR